MLRVNLRYIFSNFYSEHWCKSCPFFSCIDIWVVSIARFSTQFFHSVSLSFCWMTFFSYQKSSKTDFHFSLNCSPSYEWVQITQKLKYLKNNGSVLIYIKNIVIYYLSYNIYHVPNNSFFHKIYMAMRKFTTYHVKLY